MAVRWLDRGQHGAARLSARLAAAVTGFLVAAALVVIGAPAAHADAPQSCALAAGGIGFGSQTGILIRGKCLSYGVPGADIPGTPVQTRVVGCALAAHWQVKRCGPTQVDCKPLPGQPKPSEAFITQVLVGTDWLPAGDPWCAGQDNPVPTPGMIREQAVKLLPRIGIGAAPPRGDTLVNIQTLLWAQTPADRDLGTVTVLGHQVALRAHFDHAVWDFGDGAADTAGTPGRPFTPADRCDTKQCPGFYGHTYTRTGPMTVRLAITWTAQFRLGGTTAWLAVPGTLDGPPATRSINVVEARGVLVAN